MPSKPRLVVTLGDPCGIGPELLLATLEALRAKAELLIVGARAGIELLAPPQTVEWLHPETPEPLPREAGQYRLRVGSMEAAWIDPTPDLEARHLVLGQASAAGGRAAVEAVHLAAGLLLQGRADALVTLPLSKHAAHLAGHPIPGHTELLQQLSGAPRTRMAFVSPSLCVVLHTVHQSLRSVVEGLDADSVAETLAFSAERFMQLSGLRRPRVALCALNPHAGEHGAFGREEDVLEEALARARTLFREKARPFSDQASPFPPGPAPRGWRLYPGMDPEAGEGPDGPVFTGPLPSDTLFLRTLRGDFDLVVALYHDQGLIPVKVLEPERAVNLTLGLPFIRTSPDHGTAFDRAGRWSADPTNFLEAATLAARLAERTRQRISPAPGTGN